MLVRSAAAIVVIASGVSSALAQDECSPAFTQKILASDGAPADFYAYATAIEGDAAVVGSLNKGRVYLYRLEGDAWVEEALFERITPTFGEDVDIDGDIAVATTRNPDGDDDGATVFRFDGAGWSVDAELASKAVQFISIAVSADVVVAGTINKQGDPGAAQVYRRAGGVWEHEQELIPSDSAPDDLFGFDVDIDGDAIVVGAFGTDANVGAVYVFRYDGNAWAEEQRLGPDARDGFEFGRSVAIDGDTIVASRSFSSDGAVVFRHDGDAWTQEGLLPAALPLTTPVALAGDTALVSTFAEDPATGGQVNLYRRVGTSWIAQADIIAPDPEPGISFGVNGVAVDADTALLGAHGDNNENGAFAGAAYVFDLACGASCPGDANGDGVLNILDFVAFQQLWQGQDPAGDCDANAQFNILDFVCFQQLFQAGCQ